MSKNISGATMKAPRQFYRLSPAKIFLGINLLIISFFFIRGLVKPAALPHFRDDDLAYYNGQNLSFRGRVCEEADVDFKSRRLTVCAAGRVLVTTNLYPAYDYGDFIEVSGRLAAPPLIDGFDYESYLARYDIYSVMYYPQIKKVSGELSVSQNIYRLLLLAKQRLKLIMDSSLPEPEAGLATALLLGYRRTVAREDLEMFSRVGLSHMIAISGSHITILSALITNFFIALGLSRRRSLIFVFLFLFLYPTITGLSASAVRSAIMGGLAFLSFYYHRSSSLVNALIFSASLMLLFNPRLLQADIGFQLSFLALLGIIYLYPYGERTSRFWLKRTRLRFRSRQRLQGLLDIINLTLVSQIITLPILLINFQQFSVIAPLANLLVLWTFPPLLASLIIGLFLSGLLPFLGVWPFLPAYLLLKFIFVVSRLLAGPEWAAVQVSSFNWWWGTAYYMGLFLLIRRTNRSKKG